MKIYQLHEIGGSYEDSFDYIRGSYLKKERADEEKIKAEIEEEEAKEHSQRCEECPFYWSDINGKSIDDLGLKNLLSKYPDYCNEVKLYRTEHGIDCENYYSKWDDSTFTIEEIEVEE